MTCLMCRASYITWFCLVILYCIQNGDCSGRLQIRLKSYQDNNGLDINDQCCDGPKPATSLCKPCDPFLLACLLDKKDHGKGSCVSNNVTTIPANDTSTITFGSTTLLKENPFSLNFTVPSNNLVLQFSIYDEDKYDAQPSEPDLLEHTSYVIYTLKPLLFTESPTFRNGSIPTNKSSLYFDYFLQCDEDFYGNCDRYCHPNPAKYDCDSSGLRICKPGWVGDNCTVFDFCWNQTCQNGGSCKYGQNSFSCVCANNFTGILCENAATSVSPIESTVATSSFSQSPIGSTVATSSFTQSLNASTRKPQKTKLLKSEEAVAKNKTGVIVGAVIGTVVALALLAGGIAYFMMRQKNKIHTQTDLGHGNSDQDKSETKTDDVESNQNGNVDQLHNESEVTDANAVANNAANEGV